MASKLSGRTALITGGAKRIGSAVALALARAGVNVVIHYNRSQAEAEELADRVRKIGVRAETLQADLLLQTDLESLIERAQAEVSEFDILINNASIFPTDSFYTFSRDQLQENIDVNAWAPLVLGRSFAEKIGRGHIINFLDYRIVGYDWYHVAYHSSKSLMELFTRMMAIRLAPGVAVNAIAPGLILPPEGKDESYLEALKDRVPLRRIGSVEDVTDAVIYLLSSNYITGQILFIDGGRHLNEAALG